MSDGFSDYPSNFWKRIEQFSIIVQAWAPKALVGSATPLLVIRFEDGRAGAHYFGATPVPYQAIDLALALSQLDEIRLQPGG